MRNSRKSWLLSACGLALLLALAVPRAAAQNVGTIRGTILDVAGKPWAEIGIQVVNDQGAKSDTKTDKDGNYILHNLKSGVYSVFVQLPAPNKPYEVKTQVASGDEVRVDLNFKDIVAKQGSQYAEQAKKAEEEKSKFEGMKAHFTAGNALLDQER